MLFVVASSVFVGIKPSWANGSASTSEDVLAIKTLEKVCLSGSGNARLSIQTDVNGGPLADLYRRVLAAPADEGVGEEMLIPESRPSEMQSGQNNGGVTLPVRSVFYKGVKDEQLFSFGFTTKILNSSMVPNSSTGSLLYSVDALAFPQITSITGSGATNTWQIHLGPKDETAARRAVGFDLTKAAFAQAMLKSQGGEQQYESLLTMAIVLPEGSTLINANELEGLNWTVNFGGGTFKTASILVNESSTIILNEEFAVTEQNFTATPNELYDGLCAYGAFEIKYSLPQWATNSLETGPGVLDESGDDFSYSLTLPMWSDSITFPFDYGPLHVDLTAAASLTLAGYIGWDFGWVQHTGWFGIPYWLYEPLWFETWMSPQASVSVSFTAGASGVYSETWTHELFSWSNPYFFFAGIIPVELELEFSCNAKVTFDAHAQVLVQAEAHASVSFKAGVRWDRDKGWSNIWEQSISADHTGPDISLEADASVSAGLGFRFALMFYHTVGPFVEFWLTARAALAVLPVVSWDLSLHFTINVGVGFSGWLKTLISSDDYSWQPYDLTLFDWGGHLGVVPSLISVSASPSTTNPGSPVTIYGTISSPYPGNKSGTVYTQYSIDNATWTDLGSASSDASGYYYYTGGFNSTGTYYVRSSWDGNPNYYGATSSSFYPLSVQTSIPFLGIFQTVLLSSNSIATGQNVVVSSQLYYSYLGNVAPYQTDSGIMTLQWSTDGTLWQNISSGQPFLGNYLNIWIPPNAGTYYLRATWEGQVIIFGIPFPTGSMSPAVSLEVVQARTSLDMSLSTTSMEYGHNVTIATSILPSLENRTVKLEYSFDNLNWYFLKTGRTDWAGQYAFSWTPAVGEYCIRSEWAGDENYFGAESATQLLTVVQPSQYFLNVVSPYGTVNGTGLYDVNATAYATLSEGTYDIVPGSVRAIFVGWAGDTNGTDLTSSPIIMDGTKTAVAMWKIQFYLNVITDPSSLPAIPGADWYDNYTRLKLEATRYVPAEEGSMGVRYSFDSWDVDGVSQGAGINTIDLNMDVYHVATAHYMLQYNVMFLETSVGSDFNGTIATVDGTEYALRDFPLSFWFCNGTSHDFAFASPLRVGLGSKQYVWSFTSGLSSQQSSSIILLGPGSVTGNYETGVHDVAVTNVTADRTWVYQGFTANVNVTVLNKGDFDENVTVTLYYNITANKIIGAQNVTLSPGQNETVAFVWDTTGVPYCHNYTLTAVATIPADNNPADNTLGGGPVKVRILGDMNGDGSVDIYDAITFANYFGSKKGDARWNADADINRDGKTDILDAIVIAEHFGKSGSS